MSLTSAELTLQLGQMAEHGDQRKLLAYWHKLPESERHNWEQGYMNGALWQMYTSRTVEYKGVSQDNWLRLNLWLRPLGTRKEIEKQGKAVWESMWQTAVSLPGGHVHHEFMHVLLEHEFLLEPKHWKALWGKYADFLTPQQPARYEALKFAALEMTKMAVQAGRAEKPLTTLLQFLTEAARKQPDGLKTGWYLEALGSILKAQKKKTGKPAFAEYDIWAGFSAHEKPLALEAMVKSWELSLEDELYLSIAGGTHNLFEKFTFKHPSLPPDFKWQAERLAEVKHDDFRIKYMEFYGNFSIEGKVSPALLEDILDGSRDVHSDNSLRVLRVKPFHHNNDFLRMLKANGLELAYISHTLINGEASVEHLEQLKRQLSVQIPVHTMGKNWQDKKEAQRHIDNISLAMRREFQDAGGRAHDIDSYQAVRKGIETLQKEGIPLEGKSAVMSWLLWQRVKGETLILKPFLQKGGVLKKLTEGDDFAKEGLSDLIRQNVIAYVSGSTAPILQETLGKQKIQAILARGILGHHGGTESKKHWQPWVDCGVLTLDDGLILQFIKAGERETSWSFRTNEVMQKRTALLEFTLQNMDQKKHPKSWKECTESLEKLATYVHETFHGTTTAGHQWNLLQAMVPIVKLVKEKQMCLDSQATEIWQACLVGSMWEPEQQKQALRNMEALKLRHGAKNHGIEPVSVAGRKLQKKL